MYSKIFLEILPQLTTSVVLRFRFEKFLDIYLFSKVGKKQLQNHYLFSFYYALIPNILMHTLYFNHKLVHKIHINLLYK
jgi:hypothetical protein